MRVIRNNCINPYFNLALEEHLLTRAQGDIFMLWRNSPAVIIGRNQNAFAEVNAAYVRENNIPVVRRLTGGGAVFHDLGNVNYTFITDEKNSGFNNYGYFCRPIIAALGKLGVKAELSGRNDLLTGGKKFSGNAQCARGGRVMHHGTLMFGASVGSMVQALNVNPLKIQSKGIKSVRSRVTNISEHLSEPMAVEAFIDFILETVAQSGENEYYELCREDIDAAQRLADEKYSLPEWNYGFRKEYSVSKETLTAQGCFDVRMNIAEDKIKEIRIFGDYFCEKDISELEGRLTGVAYLPEKLLEALEAAGSYIPGMSAADMLKLII